VPLIAVASKCNRQENEIDERNVSKEDKRIITSINDQEMVCIKKKKP
jgi:hypothetical protein